MRRLAALVVAAALLLPLDVLAAPFCAVFSYGTQCYYYSWDACVEAAGDQGACVINQEEAQQPAAAGAPFCVVTSYATQCWYYDAQSCRRAAASAHGVCVVNPDR